MSERERALRLWIRRRRRRRAARAATFDYHHEAMSVLVDRVEIRRHRREVAALRAWRRISP